MNAKSYRCPNCGRSMIGQRAYVDHLLVEAGKTGVTTNQFLAWGAGSRFGARVHELRHEHGREITEINGTYVMATDVVSRAAQPATGLPGRASVAAGGQPALALDIASSKPAPQCAIFDDWEDAA